MMGRHILGAMLKDINFEIRREMLKSKLNFVSCCCSKYVKKKAYVIKHTNLVLNSKGIKTMKSEMEFLWKRWKKTRGWVFGLRKKEIMLKCCSVRCDCDRHYPAVYQ
jgi:hypothetical protein